MLIILGVIWLGGGFVRTHYFEINLPTNSWLGTVISVLLILVGLFILFYKILSLQ
jgi:prolipoprotein diacylglyceryltransferase